QEANQDAVRAALIGDSEHVVLGIDGLWPDHHAPGQRLEYVESATQRRAVGCVGCVNEQSCVRSAPSPNFHQPSDTTHFPPLPEDFGPYLAIAKLRDFTETLSPKDPDYVSKIRMAEEQMKAYEARIIRLGSGAVANALPETPDPNHAQRAEPKKKQNKNETADRNARWRTRGRELLNADPNRTIKDIATEITKETDWRGSPDTIEREIRGLKRPVKN
ncbi:MAG: hypothetical protein HQL64_06170, partial [Magnetococcales bacterium]|nr:hypothetical protein [Magnetococcales bacterium]